MTAIHESIYSEWRPWLNDWATSGSKDLTAQEKQRLIELEAHAARSEKPRVARKLEAAEPGVRFQHHRVVRRPAFWGNWYRIKHDKLEFMTRHPSLVLSGPAQADGRTGTLHFLQPHVREASDRFRFSLPETMGNGDQDNMRLLGRLTRPLLAHVGSYLTLGEVRSLVHCSRGCARMISVEQQHHQLARRIYAHHCASLAGLPNFKAPEVQGTPTPLRRERLLKWNQRVTQCLAIQWALTRPKVSLEMSRPGGAEGSPIDHFRDNSCAELTVSITDVAELVATGNAEVAAQLFHLTVHPAGYQRYRGEEIPDYGIALTPGISPIAELVDVPTVNGTVRLAELMDVPLVCGTIRVFVKVNYGKTVHYNCRGVDQALKIAAETQDFPMLRGLIDHLSELNQRGEKRRRGDIGPWDAYMYPLTLFLNGREDKEQFAKTLCDAAPTTARESEYGGIRQMWNVEWLVKHAATYAHQGLDYATGKLTVRS